MATIHAHGTLPARISPWAVACLLTLTLQRYMKFLILGGTRFVGRHLVEAAHAAGHEVTLFNRGNHPDAFPAVDTLIGDRDGNLHTLRAGSWDVAFDVSGYTAPAVAASTKLLKDAVDRYIFVSTTSVYADPQPDASAMDESAPRKKADPSTDGDYGAMKVACENVVRDVTGLGGLIVRPGIIVGPWDYTGRFAYWCRRIASAEEGETVLAPGAPDRPVQFIDARDLGRWMVRMAERRAGGTFNAVGPEEPLTMGGMVEGIREITKKENVEFAWVGDDALRDAGESPPFWVPEEKAATFTFDASAARLKGLTHRALHEIVRETLAWNSEKAGVEVRDAGMSRERERELLAAAG